jgi:hypothetical protein
MTNEYKFKATELDVYKVCTAAINASKPVGLGKIHYKEKVYTVDEVIQKLTTNHSDNLKGAWLYIDYFEGRMVKLTIDRHYRDRETWAFRGFPHPDYQSWAETYPTYEALTHSVFSRGD